MDVRAKQWMRSWVLSAAAASVMGPGFLTAQTGRPAAPQPQQRTSTTQPALLKPAPAAVNLAAYEPAADGVDVAESEVEQRLRELYERDGREMPNMTLTPAPADGAPGQGGAPRAVPASRPRYSSAPPAAPAPKPQNKVTGFFKKLVPGNQKKVPTQAQAVAAPPRQLPTTNPQQPAQQQQQQLAVQQQPAVQPQPVVQQQPAFSQPQTNGQFATPASGAAQPAARVIAAPVQSAPVANSQVVARPTSPASAGSARVTPRPAAAGNQAPAYTPTPAPHQSVPSQTPIVERDAAPRIQEPEMSFEADDDEEEATPFAPVTAPGLNDDFPDPFAGAEGEATEPTEAAEAAETANPYSGMTLEAPETETLELPGPVITPNARVDEPAVDESTATKMRRIIQRTDMKGLKGFCPVTLRDQRELADSRPEHIAAYRGQKFYCASKVAQAKFESDPARYAPAAYGADVVVLTDDQDVAEGSLDFAAWYKGRLYLFANQQTHDTFVENPERYASPPGIE